MIASISDLDFIKPVMTASVMAPVPTKPSFIVPPKSDVFLYHNAISSPSHVKWIGTVLSLNNMISLQVVEYGRFLSCAAALIV